MFKVVFLIKRKAGVSREDFLKHWTGHHREMAMGLPGIRHYTQRHLTSMPNMADFDGIAELTFDSKEAYLESRASAKFNAAYADGHEFVDLEGMVVVPVIKELSESI